MEHIHGIDISWMTHGNPKDPGAKTAGTRKKSLSRTPPTNGPAPPSPPPPTSRRGPASSPSPSPSPLQSLSPAASTPPKSIPASRTGRNRSPSVPGEGNAPPTGASSQRRNSWFSNFSSKFSGTGQSPPQTGSPPAKQTEPAVPKVVPSKNAVLQHAAKHDGQVPYTPAPPKSTQAGILHVFRKLSSSNGFVPGLRGSNHGLVERRILNVDQQRERCPISELNQAKLRRVAFCVDVEIAPMPKYADADPALRPKPCGANGGDKNQRRRLAEKSEGEALKHPKAVEAQKEEDGEIKATGEEVPKEPAKEGVEAGKGATPSASCGRPAASPPPPRRPDSSRPQPQPQQNPAEAKKREKKKKSEEERKARKEKRRRLAEANGTVPMEIHFDSDTSDESPTPASDAPRTPQQTPTTNPVRIYRRCCQLRETPVLKKITEQLTDARNCSVELGMVEKLDLTGYWMQLTDLVALGDYLAVVPIKEVVLENCGLTDEGLRVLLAGLLAAQKSGGSRRRRRGAASEVDGSTRHPRGVVERLVLKNNKFGPEGWKHLCVFLYLCRSLKFLDLSSISFPQQPSPPSNLSPQQQLLHQQHQNFLHPHLHHPQHPQARFMDAPGSSLCQLFATALRDRLGGSTLSLLNMGETGLDAEQLGLIVDGLISCGVKRLGIAHNNLDGQGMQHVARYLRSQKCEGLDLGGNDLQDELPTLADALAEAESLGVLSLAECNLTPSSLCELLPQLVKLPDFRFIDLSHNHDLFDSKPSAVRALRRFLPQMTTLKRIHLANCAMSPEQAIALAEIVPEVTDLAHISLLQNPEIARLMDAKTEEAQEEACALFASLLAATRLSTSLICIDIEVPSERSSDLVKAMAKQVVAYCLRNMESFPLSDLAAATMAQTEASAKHDADYPDVLQHLIGHDVASPPELDADIEVAPDDDYVIGGTGVVKALTCCLKNRGDESGGQSGEFIRELENGTPLPDSEVSPGKAKDTSKHLLSSARKIRQRLQPAIIRAKETSGEDTRAYHRLIFLDKILQGIIKRFEDEFPETREEEPAGDVVSTTSSSGSQPAQLLGTSPSSTDPDLMPAASVSDAEDEPDYTIKSPVLSRSNSVISVSSKALANEEGRVLRAGHKFRTGIVKPEAYMLLSSGIEMVGADPNHVRVLYEMLHELGDEELLRKADEVGVVRVFREDKDRVLHKLRQADPEHWERFAESQMMARKNAKVDGDKEATKPSGAGVVGVGSGSESECAVVLDEEISESAEEGLTRESTESVDNSSSGRGATVQ